jgi:hypothetical protein
MAQSHREAARRLFEFAEQQQGFFTTKQAKAAGFAENTHPYHVQVGNWIREHRCLALIPLCTAALALPALLLGQRPNSALAGIAEPGWFYVLSAKPNERGQFTLIEPGSRKRVGQIATGFGPDAVLSPDRKSIYVSSREPGPNPNEAWPSKLEVIDAAAGRLIHSIENPHGLIWGTPAPFSFMAPSTEGDRVYIFKRRSIAPGIAQAVDRHWIETYDTALRGFLPNKVALPYCTGAQLLPGSKGQLLVICGGESAISFVTVSPDGSGVLEQLRLPADREESLPYVADAQISQSALLPGQRQALLVRRDGRLIKLDVNGRRIIGLTKKPPYPGSWMPYGTPVLSAKSGRIYLPVSYY